MDDYAGQTVLITGGASGMDEFRGRRATGEAVRPAVRQIGGDRRAARPD